MGGSNGKRNFSFNRSDTDDRVGIVAEHKEVGQPQGTGDNQIPMDVLFNLMPNGPSSGCR